MEEFIIKNKVLELHTHPFGAGMAGLYFNDKAGMRRNMIYGYTRGENYLGNPFFLGATCGRYAGRISDHGFTIAGQRYELESEGPVHLHGGSKTLGFRPWQLKKHQTGANPEIVYHLSSPHLEGGYPGNIEVEAQYRLSDNILEITYRARTDQATHINLTNHNYYNLNGGGSIKNHILHLPASGRLELGTLNVPTGTILNVAGTPYDFNAPTPMEQALKEISLDDVYTQKGAAVHAVLYAPQSGIKMTMKTNQPGVVVFTPKSLEGGPFRNTEPGDFPAICLEPQNYPNAPNNDSFPSSLLLPGERYENKIVLEFTRE